jgi:DNA-binding transcriptional LysR family regulator
MFEALFRTRGLTLERLWAFARIEQHRKIASVAPGDPTEQSQLSRQLGELRAFFGDPLLERRGRNLEPTEAGRLLARVARDTLTGLEEVAGIAGQAPSRFVLGGGDSLLQWWVIPRLGTVLDRIATASLELLALSPDDVRERLVEGSVDIGLAKGGTLPGLQSKRLGTLRYVLFVPRGLSRRSADLSEMLREVPMVLATGEQQVADAVRRLGGAGGPRVRLCCETFPQAARAVLSGRYAAVLPRIARTEFPSQDFRTFDLPPSPAFEAEVRLAWRARTKKMRMVAAPLLRELVREMTLAE